jgi:methoxymalonate biosynthesis acyl carrier protein
MNPETIKAQIRAFVAKFIHNTDLQDDDDIFALGFVNSLFSMQLVMFVEQAFSITVEDEDLNIDNFRSINAMTGLITSKAL